MQPTAFFCFQRRLCGFVRFSCAPCGASGLAVKLFLDGHEQPLDGVGDQEHQKDGQSGRSVLIALQISRNHAADSARAHHAEDRAF